MIDFARFDARGYPTVEPLEGYQGWAATYEDSVLDLMDLNLAERVEGLVWSAVASAADLACGTGRVGAWLTGKGVGAVDGADITPAMLERARARGLYRTLCLADLADTGLPGASYDLVTQILADEHLGRLEPAYAEAARLARERGRFLLVGYHPWFLMHSGMPTHYDPEPGRSVAIRSHIHLLSDHVRAARAAGWTLGDLVEGLIDDAWVAAKPKWERWRDRPISFAALWTRG